MADGGARARRLLSLHTDGRVTCASAHIGETAFVLSGADTGAVHLFQVNNGSLVASLCDTGALGSATSALCWERGEGAGGDASHVFAGSDTGSIRLWDLERQQVAGTFRGHKAAPACLSHCCATGTLASGSQDTTVKLWDARTRDAARTLKGQGAAITHVAHSPDGQLVVSGSEAGTLQVWDMPTGRLLRELRGHTKRVHSLAFHPEETLLASASADRTVRFWDLGAGTGAPVEVDKAGPAAREARAVAFPSDGRALLAAAADGLRAYGWEPTREHDAVAVPWAKVSELCYFDGKAFGLGFAHDLIDMWTVDLTQVRPFGEPRRPATCPDRRRLSFQEAIVQGTAISQSAEGLARRAEPALPPPPAAAPRLPSVLPPGGRGPAAQFVAEKRRQLAVGPRGPRPASTAAGLQVLTTPGLRAVPAQRNSPTRPATGALSQLHLDTSSSTLSLGSEGSLAGPAEGQHSAAENALFPDGPSGGNAPAGPPHAQPQRDSGDATCCPAAGSLTVQAADAVLVGHGEVRAGLRARAGRLKEVRVLMARGDSRGVATAVRAYQDLAITMHVVARWAALPDPPLELCIEAAALCGELLGSGEPLNQDVGVQLVAATLRRWGGYIAGALSTAFARQGVDVEYESRRKRCARCKDRLQALLPGLSQLAAAGNTRAAQLHSQVSEL